jgi:hypothetical protein
MPSPQPQPRKLFWVFVAGFFVLVSYFFFFKATPTETKGYSQKTGWVPSTHGAYGTYGYTNYTRNTTTTAGTTSYSLAAATPSWILGTSWIYRDTTCDWRSTSYTTDYATA